MLMLLRAWMGANEAAIGQADAREELGLGGGLAARPDPFR